MHCFPLISDCWVLWWLEEMMHVPEHHHDPRTWLSLTQHKGFLMIVPLDQTCPKIGLDTTWWVGHDSEPKWGWYSMIWLGRASCTWWRHNARERRPCVDNWRPMEMILVIPHLDLGPLELLWGGFEGFYSNDGWSWHMATFLALHITSRAQKWNDIII